MMPNLQAIKKIVNKILACKSKAFLSSVEQQKY